MNGSQDTAARRRSPLDRARGNEVIWQQVAPLFEAAAAYGAATFVYLICEADDGPIKIGYGKDPITRLRDMQTGNPRPLRIERVVIGGRAVEKMLHQMWLSFAVGGSAGTEWFRPEARPQLLPIITTAARLQVKSIRDSPAKPPLERLERFVSVAHKRAEFVVQGRDTERFYSRNGIALS